MTLPEPTGRPSRDMLSGPWSAALWWGLPLLAGFSTNAAPIAPSAAIFVWAGAFAWMGVGCALNALRCHRLHCYVSAPVLFLGAAAMVASGLGLAPFGRGAAGWVVNATLLLTLATFLVEPVWGRYRGR